MIYSDQISNALNTFHDYISRNISACKNHPASRVSAFWAEHFADRGNFPDVREFMTFRRGNYVYGIGDTAPASPARKQQEFDMVSRSMALLVPQEYIEKLREPVIGAPLVYSLGNAQISASYLLNAGTSWRIAELLRQHGLEGRPLRICEIGAGWGACSRQLHEICNVASYTIIDLPENLCLSSAYLSTTLPERSAHFVECGQDGQAQGELRFALPPAIDRLNGPFDLIINTMSFQEMDRETVDTYFSWVARVLAQDGVLMSFNAHDKAGILRPSDYLHSGLKLCHLMPFRKVPAGYFNTIPYEAVFRRADVAMGSAVAAAIDALGEMVQLGLDSDIAQWSRQTLVEQDPAIIAWLEKVREFFYANNESSRQRSLDALTKAGEQFVAVAAFLAGNYWYAQGHFDVARLNLERSLECGLQDFAAIRATVLLTSLQKNRNVDHLLARLAGSAGGLDEEISAIIKAGDIARMQDHISRVLDCSVSRSGNSRGIVRNVLARLNIFG